MSHIPNSAMPHAAPKAHDDNGGKKKGGARSKAGKLADKARETARENPKTAIAAGVAVAAGAIAAAAIPIVKAARNKNEPKAPKVASPRKSKTN